MEAKCLWDVSAEQEQKYSQIVTFCDDILRKQDNMIISFICSQLRDDTREADSRDMRYRENSRPTLFDGIITWSMSSAK